MSQGDIHVDKAEYEKAIDRYSEAINVRAIPDSEVLVRRAFALMNLFK